MNTVGKAIVAASCALAASSAALGAGYIQTNLVSTDSSVPAVQHDSNLVNAWGLTETATSPFWVGSNGQGLAMIFDGTGTQPRVPVTVPPVPGSPAGTMSAPTGVVTGAGSDFGGASFLFATEDGTIAGWKNSLGNTAQINVDSSPGGAVYKGLAKGTSGTTNMLFAADFHNGRIDTFGPTFAPITPAGGFTVPNLPSGYAPFNIQNLGGTLYVTYAKTDPNSGDEVDGPGLGLVAKFDVNGSYLGTLTSGGNLNAPWGLALAPANFGELSNDLLVGNFGDGRINAYNSTTGAFLGTLNNAQGQPLTISGLWGISFGNGGNGGQTNVLYFAAGPAGESLGLYGSIAVVPEPGTMAAVGGAVAMLLVRRRRR